MDERPVLELRGITKRFPGIVANDGVDFDLRQGEVHALLGENGAGKSTLMNVLYGLYRPDEGEILINGKPAELGSPKAAIENGVGMVHQHFMLIPVMTVAENIVLATEPTRGRVFLDLESARERVREISERYGLAVDPGAKIENISVGMQQRVRLAAPEVEVDAVVRDDAGEPLRDAAQFEDRFVRHPRGILRRRAAAGSLTRGRRRAGLGPPFARLQ